MQILSFKLLFHKNFYPRLNLLQVTAMASLAKKPKLKEIKTPKEVNKQPENFDDFLKKMYKKRAETANSIAEFKFNKKRVRVLSQEQEIPEDCEGVLYWMQRDSRVQDNWAFLYAQKLALKVGVPLYVCHCLASSYLSGSVRAYDFLLKGLKEVAEDCKKLNIDFHLLHGTAEQVLPTWVKENKIGCVVCDFNPIQPPLTWVEEVKKKLKKDVPIIQIDAHNIVPCWHASDKLEYAARTIRNKINSKLGEFLTEFPPVICHPHDSKIYLKEIDWDGALEWVGADKNVGPVDWAKPGTKEGLKILHSFVEKRLKQYATARNDPTKDGLSNLSPWFHFGQIAPQRAVLIVQEYRSQYSESVNAFCEEAIVRSELSDNFCFYNENYDKIEGTNDWAKKTLREHSKDKRPYIYSLKQLEQAETHDELWNSAQLQMVKTGKMHGFMRMYWAKKILEWTRSPEEALEFSIYLNDHYSLDGRDPNGYVGCMWSICGIHDQGWTERAVFGKIRYMNYNGCKRKFDINTYVARYGGKIHKYIAPKEE